MCCHLVSQFDLGFYHLDSSMFVIYYVCSFQWDQNLKTISVHFLYVNRFVNPYIWCQKSHTETSCRSTYFSCHTASRKSPSNVSTCWPSWPRLGKIELEHHRKIWINMGQSVENGDLKMIQIIYVEWIWFNDMFNVGKLNAIHLPFGDGFNRTN